MASFSTMPIELLCLVADCFTDRDKRHALAALAATSRRNNWVFNAMLYQADIDLSPPRAMMWAAATGNIKTLELAMVHGADINYAYSLGGYWDAPWEPPNFARFAFSILPLSGAHASFQGTALHFATMRGYDDAVEWLVDHGARLDIGASYLCDCHTRLGGNGSQLWRFLRRSLPDLNALHLALCFGRASTFRALVGRGASMKKTCEGHGLVVGTPQGPDDELYPTELHQAVYVGNREIFDFILNWPGSTAESPISVTTTVDGLSTLELVYLGSGLGSREDRAYIMRTLIKHGARLPESRRVLLRACQYGAFGTAVDLLESGACPPPCNESLPELMHETLRGSPTRQSFSSGDDYADRVYLARVDFRQCERVEFLRLLFKYGADPSGASYPEDWGETPLMLAAHPAHPHDMALEMVKLIIDHGADAEAMDRCGRPLLHYLVDEAMSATDQYVYGLTESRPRYDPPLAVIQYLVKEVGVRIDAPDDGGLTVLDYVYDGVSSFGDEEQNWLYFHTWWRQAVALAECILNNSTHPIPQEMAEKEVARLHHAKQMLAYGEERWTA